MTNKFPMRNKFLPSTSSPNDEINIVQVEKFSALTHKKITAVIGTYDDL